MNLKNRMLQGWKKAIVPLIAVAVVVATGTGLLFFYSSQPKPQIKAANKQFVVVIDAGHGGKDEGTKFKNFKEKDITLAIAKQVEALAPEYGVKTVLTRHTDTFLNPVSRVTIASLANADAYISIHVNELKGYSYVNGMQVYVSDKNPDFEQSRTLGSAISQDLGADFKVSPRLQQRAENIFVLADNFMPSVLIECGFITSPADLKMLTDSSKIELIAKHILDGVAAYAKHATINQYAVQVGSPSSSSVTHHTKAVVSTPARNKKGYKKALKTA